MSDVGGEIAENCGFEGKILCEVPQGAHSCDTTATGYKPPEGWRVLAVGEQLQEGDQIVQLHDGKRFPTERAGQYVCETQRYIRPIEPQPQPQPEPEPEPESDADLRIRLLKEANDSQAETIGRLQAAIDERAELGGADQTRAELQACIRELEAIRDTQAATIKELRSEVSYVHRVLGASRERVTRLEELVTSLRTINEAQEKSFNAANKANDDLQHRLNVVSFEWAEQAETIKRLQARICVSEIRRNETLREQLDAAATELQKLHPDHVVRAISTDEWMDQFARDASVSRLQADRNDLAGKVISLREQLQLANDKLAQLEVLQPIAAACHTAQTMVRDMLGHMRCLLALHHTTDRSNFCALLESILEVFDDAECDEDEDEDTTNTSEAGQG